MKVVIAVPTTGQVVSAALPGTVVNAALAVSAVGADFAYQTIDGANVTAARDYLAHVFLADTAATHILYLDHDMSVPQAVFARFLARDAPFCAAIYTTRELDLDGYARGRADGQSVDAARARASRFNVNISPGKVTVRDGFVPVDGLALGVALIRREVFERVRREGDAPAVPTRRLAAFGAGERMVSYFAPTVGADGAPMSEDYSFCARVRRLGIEIVGYVEGGVSHVGAFAYGAPFSARFNKN